jgi:hypothetical protein
LNLPFERHDKHIGAPVMHRTGLRGKRKHGVMKMVLTAAILSAALLLAVVSVVEAKEPNTVHPADVTPIVVYGE